jgi:formylglycine-generating enzyme required for sulfatase activity
LPTEAEWEYAARGGKYSKGYKYSGSNNIDEVAWYSDNYQNSRNGTTGTTHPAGTKKSNELGIYDMSGNVWEWCNVINDSIMVFGTKLPFRSVIRGGSWGGTATGCRVSYRDYDIPTYHDEFGGFRLALVP